MTPKNKPQQKSLKSQNKVTTDDTAIGAGTLTWQALVHSWKAGTGEVMTVENKQINYAGFNVLYLLSWSILDSRNLWK